MPPSGPLRSLSGSILDSRCSQPPCAPSALAGLQAAAGSGRPGAAGCRHRVWGLGDTACCQLTQAAPILWTPQVVIETAAASYAFRFMSFDDLEQVVIHVTMSLKKVFPDSSPG